MPKAAAGAAPRPNPRDMLRQHWRALARRERMAAAAALAVVVLALVWLLALAPALHTLRQAPAELDRLERQLQQMQRLAAQSADLRNAVPVSPSQASTALQSATARLGSKARLMLQGERATVTFTGVSSEEMRAWLAEARSAARAQPVEAQLTRAGEGYSGTLTLSLPGNP